MRDEAETIGVPVILMLLLVATLELSGLNTPLFLAAKQLAELFPDALWANLTILGDALVAMVLLSLLAGRYPALLPAGILAGLIATLWSRSLKNLLEVERPLTVLGSQVHVIGSDLFNFSFPSGHTTAAFVVAGVYALVLQRDRVTAALFCVALLAGFSRIAVGAHWPMDVCAGAALGWFSAWAGWKLAAGWHWSRSHRGQQVLAALFLLLALALFGLNTGYPQAFWLQMSIASAATLASLLTLWHTWHNTT
ncbi:phosphatase PAP2 family protein [Thiothrix litoralis]|uniref:undecaprenyl-diphosphate phosphatase n=2 Tax=Thiothrix litoralis TaxID=2891210 RepID=A0ABX7WRV7_9GAMM|nr:phosphatase PAP2 family protein [Thiothrix litoralis]QTR45722.1 phosphatase PAP2 family protein [Thiothrix litoralis]